MGTRIFGSEKELEALRWFWEMSKGCRHIACNRLAGGGGAAKPPPVPLSRLEVAMFRP